MKFNLPNYEFIRCICQVATVREPVLDSLSWQSCSVPTQSVENSTIKVFVSKLPDGMIPETDDSGMTAIAIPDSKAKPAATFNYLSPRGKIAVAECCDLTFNRCLWTELGDMRSMGCKTLTPNAA